MSVLLSYVQLPSSFFRTRILFLCRLIKIVVWKNFVIRSPSISLFILDFSFQKSSSCLSSELYLLMRVCSSCKRNLLDVWFENFWFLQFDEVTFFFLTKILSKVFLFHSLTFWINFGIASRMLHELFKAFVIIFCRSGCDIYMISNLNILVRFKSDLF